MGFTKKKNPEITEPKVLENWENILGKDQDIVSLVLISFFASSSGKDWEEDPELVNIF